MRGLRDSGVLNENSTITNFRKEIYQHEMSMRENGNPVTDRILEPNGSRLGNDKGSQYSRDWLRKVYHESLPFEGGATIRFWFDSQPLMGALAIMYFRSFVSYSKENVTTCLWFYEEKSQQVTYFHEKGFFCPPPYSICIVHNGRDHYEYLELKRQHTDQEAKKVEMRMLRAGDIIQYRSSDDNNQVHQSKIQMIQPDDNASTILLDNNFYLSKSTSIFEIRKVETENQAETTWGFVESYSLSRSRFQKRRSSDKAGATDTITDKECESVMVKDEKVEALKDKLTNAYKTFKEKEDTDAKKNDKKHQRIKKMKDTKKKNGNNGSYVQTVTREVTSMRSGTK